MLSWWRKWKYRNHLAQIDATVLIARYGVRASYIANSRAATMRNGSMFDSNRPPCHWKLFIPLHVNYCPMMETMGRCLKRLDQTPVLNPHRVHRAY